MPRGIGRKKTMSGPSLSDSVLAFVQAVSVVSDCSWKDLSIDFLSWVQVSLGELPAAKVSREEGFPE